MLDAIFTILDKIFEKMIYVWDSIPLFIDSFRNYLVNQYNLLYSENQILLFTLMFICVMFTIIFAYIMFSVIHKKIKVVTNIFSNNTYYKRNYKNNISQDENNDCWSNNNFSYNSNKVSHDLSYFGYDNSTIGYNSNKTFHDLSYDPTYRNVSGNIFHKNIGE